MKKQTSIIVCSLTSGLDEMLKRDQKDPVKVLRVLQACKRYSVFEATDNLTIARMVTRMHHKDFVRFNPDGTQKNYGKLLKTTGGSFPWTEVELTAGGESLLNDHPINEPINAN